MWNFRSDINSDTRLYHKKALFLGCLIWHKMQTGDSPSRIGTSQKVVKLAIVVTMLQINFKEGSQWLQAKGKRFTNLQIKEEGKKERVQ